MPKVPQSRGYLARRPTEVTSHVVPHAGSLVDRASRYFGIDLKRLPQMSDRELAQYADRANQMKRLTEILPILEKHFTTLIEGQTTYEEFINRILKLVQKNSKKIDKTILDSWLLSKGYDAHLKMMNQEAAQGAQKLQAEFRSEYDLNNLDFQSALRLIHLRHRNRAKQIREKVPRAIASMQVQEQQRLETERRRELLTYGTQGKPGKGAWQRVKDFFTL